MRISDWSSDVCSSDLRDDLRRKARRRGGRKQRLQVAAAPGDDHADFQSVRHRLQPLALATTKAVVPAFVAGTQCLSRFIGTRRSSTPSSRLTRKQTAKAVATGVRQRIPGPSPGMTEVYTANAKHKYGVSKSTK